MNHFISFPKRVLDIFARDYINSPHIDVTKIGTDLTPNLHALQLVMTLADQLLSMGMPASSVVHLVVDITDVYCTSPVHIDISYTQIVISQDRGLHYDPLTMIRTITPRETNYRLMQQLEELATKIADHRLTLDDAEKQLNIMLTRNNRYPKFIIYLSGGGLSLGSSLLYTTSPISLAETFIVGTLITWLLHRLIRRAVPSFFIQIIAALFVTIIAAGTAFALNQYPISWLSSFSPTIITVNGIVLLVSGMAIVGAFQNAIDEYYVTASAHFLKVCMMTGGIVLGVGIGLYAAKIMNISFVVTSDKLSLTSTIYQCIGATIIAASFALGNHMRLPHVFLVGMVGLAGYAVYLVVAAASITNIAANGLAGLAIGLIAAFVSKIIHLPSFAVISSGIVPLVPGLLLYNGLMNLVTGVGWSNGFSLIMQAILIAVTIATGASFGTMIGRPSRLGLTSRLRNAMLINK